MNGNKFRAIKRRNKAARATPRCDREKHRGEKTEREKERLEIFRSGNLGNVKGRKVK